jgi:hypothetical protein
LRHILTRGKDAAKIAEAVGRADWLLHMIMMSSTNFTLGIENQGPFLPAGHYVMGLFKNNWGAKRQIGLAKGKWGAKRQMWVPKRQRGAKKGRWGIIRHVGCHEALGCHKACGVP